MSPELTWVASMALITALMWLPYILSLLGQMGVAGALADAEHDTELQAGWARRCKRAHANAVENLVVFAPLAIGIHVAGIGSGTTATACAVFFYARLAHYVIYTLGVPYLRTPAFAVSWVCLIVLALTLMGGA